MLPPVKRKKVSEVPPVAATSKSPRKSTPPARADLGFDIDDEEIEIEEDPSQRAPQASPEWTNSRPNVAESSSSLGSLTQPFAVPVASGRKALSPDPSLIAPIASRKRSLSNLLPPSMLKQTVLVLEEAQWAPHESELMKQLGPKTTIINITFRAAVLPWQKFSPKYGHGGIPIRFCSDRKAMSVEGIFESLKVIDGATDANKLAIQDGKHIRRKGAVHGWSRGFREILIDEARARRIYFVEPYRYQLNNCLQREVEVLRKILAKGHKLVILDESTCEDYHDMSEPISTGQILKTWLTGEQSEASILNDTVDSTRQD